MNVPHRPSLHVTQLYVYPVKSCRGIAVDVLEFDPFGAVADRRFLIVDEQGLAVTQRSDPALATVATALNPTHLTLQHEQLGVLKVPRASPEAAPRQVQVWGDAGLHSDDCGDAAADWFSTLLGRRVRLVRTAADFQRPVRRSNADQVGFADAYPLLVLTEASLALLNERLTANGAEPVPMNRFRPNVVIGGGEPHAEDTWTEIRIGEVLIQPATPCARCVMVTTDQLTGARHREPLQTLARYRRDPAKPQDVNFGRNAINVTKRGQIRVGDPVVAR